MFWDHSWAGEARCSDVSPDLLFARGAAQRQVRSVCFSCPVRTECLIDALESKVPYGVWGGLTERERRALLRQLPEVTDWRDWLENADDELAVEVRASREPRILAIVRAS